MGLFNLSIIYKAFKYLHHSWKQVHLLFLFLLMSIRSDFRWKTLPRLIWLKSRASTRTRVEWHAGSVSSLSFCSLPHHLHTLSFLFYPYQCWHPPSQKAQMKTPFRVSMRSEWLSVSESSDLCDSFSTVQETCAGVNSSPERAGDLAENQSHWVSGSFIFLCSAKIVFTATPE